MVYSTLYITLTPANAQSPARKVHGKLGDRLWEPLGCEVGVEVGMDAASAVECVCVCEGSGVFDAVLLVVGLFVSALGLYALPDTLETTQAAASSLYKSK